KRDVRRFITDARVLDIWSRDYFMELAQRVTFSD
ncbi:MAG: nucleotidyl transferase AbiEii/AbiGii toxin family protein, partial [Gammaproteobacteria bacterium]|nr:nucleotidyl transferase AbiEii/AbiGii toxin family protein [Gammaproteobacteria bacterium]